MFNQVHSISLPPPIPFQLSHEDFSNAQITAGACEIFIIAHELAHIVLGHTDEYTTVPITAEGKEVHVEKLNPRQQQELDADCQAFQWICQLDRESSNPIVCLAAFGPILAAEVLMMIYFVEKSLGAHPSAHSSHPTGIQRLQNIGKRCGHLINEDNARNLERWLKRTAID